MKEQDQLYQRITELNEEIARLNLSLDEARKVIIDTREAWRKTGQPLDDVWERGSAWLKKYPKEQL